MTDTRLSKTTAGEICDDARLAAGLTWTAVAEAVDAPKLWVISAILGQHPMSGDQAGRVQDLLGVDDEVLAALMRQPTRGPGEFALPTDPTLYRFYEALMVYGPAIKEVVHEDFGDGIMSAINFRIDARKVPDPAGDRVVVTFDGKFLPYAW